MVSDVIKLSRLLDDDAGAVTVDWVALTASILLLGLVAVFSIFTNGAAPLVSRTNSTLSDMTIDIPTALNQ
jgi:hypothetical protein